MASEVRQRKGKEPAAAGTTADDVPDAPPTPAGDDGKGAAEVPKKTDNEYVDEEDKYSPWLDIVRVVTFLALVSCGLSYLISGGETYTWGMKNPPNYLSKNWWLRQFTPPIHLTIPELAVYDGTDESKPLYLAINGTIYDVSANRRIYGPGGSYNIFAGTDASRGFVTGCFREDRTADMRGVEAMFLPLEDADADARYPPAELARLREEELVEARDRVHSSLLHWVEFFANSKKYHRVGYVKREPGWPETEPLPPLCAGAQKKRKPRPAPQA